MIHQKLIQAEIIAIPLKPNESHPLGVAQPNFMVIKKLFSKLPVQLPEPLGLRTCMQTEYEIVYREILPSTELKAEDFREVKFEGDNQPIPFPIVPALESYETLLAAKDEVNAMLSLFQFRGLLSDFQLILDEDVINQILTIE